MNELKQIRKKLGLTQSQFCAKIGIPLRTYQRWEKGEISSNMASLIKFLIEWNETVNG